MTEGQVWPGSVQVPVLRLGDVLLVTIQGDLYDQSAEQLQHEVLRRIADGSVTGVVIDISTVEVVDSFLGRVFAEIAAGARLLAARTVVTGMRPSVAITMVELGLSLTGLSTALDVRSALEMLGEHLAGDPARPAFERGERGPGDTPRY